MNQPTFFNPDFPHLTNDDIGQAAVNGQVISYPMVVKKMVDPTIVDGDSVQKFGNLSFMLFETPKMFNGKPIYGYVKLRGHYSCEETARNKAYNLVREVDSKYQIRIAPVGVWVPISESDSVIKELYDVREKENEIHLRDQAIKEKEKEDNRKIAEIKEARERLEKDGDIYDDPESIRFYTMKRVTEMTLTEAYHAQVSKIKELEKKIGEQRIILKRIEVDYPNYPSEWIDCYNAERAKTSLSTFIPGETQFAEYEACTLEGLRSQFPEPRPEAIGKSSKAPEDEDKTPLIGNNNSDISKKSGK